MSCLKFQFYAFEMSTLRESNLLFEFEIILEQNDANEKSIHIDDSEKYMRNVISL